MTTYVKFRLRVNDTWRWFQSSGPMGPETAEQLKIDLLEQFPDCQAYVWKV